MKRKFVLLLGALCALLLAVSTFAVACGGDKDAQHVHRLFDFEATEATCVSEGNIAYKECLYCRKKLVDGKEVADEDVIIPVDTTKHKSLTQIEAKAEKCFETGVIAHDECMDCHRLYKDGAEVQASAVIIPEKGTHSFASNALTCSECEAYKVLYNGDYHIIDSRNKLAITTNPKGASYSSTNKATYIASNFANRPSFSTQTGTGMSASNKNGEEWVVSRTNGALSCFTRFAYGNGSTPYIGRMLVTFDIVVTEDTEVQRIGVKVVDNTATVFAGVQQAKLLGTNAAEENNPNRKLTVGTKYRFVYAVEATGAEQLVQIFTVFGGAQTVTISDVHVVELEEKTGRLGSTLCWFGEADKVITVKENCTHAWKYAVDAVSATCIIEGVKAHDWCPQCGERTVGGNPATDAIMARVDHDYGELQAAVESTCEQQGNDAYYRCTWCKEYFSETKTKLEGLPLRELAAHRGEWLSDVNGHWKHCTTCDKDVENSAHIPGPEATETTHQVCIECGYVIVSMLSHTHTPSAKVEAKEANCVEDGNVEYWQCTDPECGKYFSDEACTHEISDIFRGKLGHNMEAGVEAKDATCTEDGNLAYHHCTRCGKYFDDENGTNDITDTYLIRSEGHKMTDAAVSAATCFKPGVKKAYSHCSACGKYFADKTGAEELDEASLFDYDMPEHNFESDVCTNAGCGAARQASTITACGPNAFGTQGAVIGPELVANPGTWSCQGSGSGNTGVVGSIKDGKLVIAVGSHNSNVRSGFVRTLPAKDGKAFVGTYLWCFDFTVTEAANNAETVTLTVGFFVQSTAQSGNLGTIADAAAVFKVGTTYRFAVLVETTDEFQFVQMNVRNAAKGGIKTVVIDNASFVLYPDTADMGSVRLVSDTFAQTSEPAAPEALAEEPAILPERYEYVY